MFVPSHQSTCFRGQRYNEFGLADNAGTTNKTNAIPDIQGLTNSDLQTSFDGSDSDIDAFSDELPLI
jgi:hypothetical protein